MPLIVPTSTRRPPCATVGVAKRDAAGTSRVRSVRPDDSASSANVAPSTTYATAPASTGDPVTEDCHPHDSDRDPTCRARTPPLHGRYTVLPRAAAPPYASHPDREASCLPTPPSDVDSK